MLKKKSRRKEIFERIANIKRNTKIVVFQPCVPNSNKEFITSGASSDIQQAANYINSYFSELGMSEKFGMLAIKDDKLYMDEAIKLSNELYKDTVKLLKNNEDKLARIAEELIVKETLTGKDIDEILASCL